ncbi:MAG: hypothetical protein KBD53_12240, partial [Candidatus Omnitrophica bacterium]|nr:hypothetical protein [Candidatus Omnitrophota bacterium]
MKLHLRMKKGLFFKFTAWVVLFSFLSTPLAPSYSFAQESFFLPNPGIMITNTPAFVPPLLKGMKVDVENPFSFDFILDSGNADLSQDELKQEADTLIKYFLASLTIPETDLWVNLSPYEKDRIIPDEFGQTEMGRDLLAQDYILKQLTASLIYPEKELGKTFWDKVYKRAQELYGTTNVPINTFNKVWILPDKALVYENEDTAYVLESHLKVMLEVDYLAMKNNLDNKIIVTDQLQEEKIKELNNVSSQIIREIIIPEIEKEVNEGKNFAKLRQVYHSLILAKWYKDSLKESIINREYSDQKKVAGVAVNDKQVNEKIYEQYLKAFKDGVFNYIKEDYDTATREIIPRQYFSGGMIFHVPLQTTTDSAMLVNARHTGKLHWINGGYRQSGLWFEKLDHLKLPDVRKKIFGKNVEIWLGLQERTLDSKALENTVRQLLRSPAFVDNLKIIHKEDVPLEFIRFVVENNIYLGRKGIQLLFDALERQAPAVIRKKISDFLLLLPDYIELISNLGMIQSYLDSEEFASIPKNERLVSIVVKFIEMELPINTNELTRFYAVLPHQLSQKVRKADIAGLDPANIVADQLKVALADKRMKDYVDNDNKEYWQIPRGKHAQAIHQKIREYGLTLDTYSPSLIEMNLPAPVKVKPPVQVKQRVLKHRVLVKDQISVILGEQRTQDFLDSDDFFKIPPEDRLMALIEITGINVSPGFLYRKLPQQLSNKVHKKDIKKVRVKKSIYYQLRNVRRNLKLQEFANSAKYLQMPLTPKERGNAILEEIHRLGIQLNKIKPELLYEELSSEFKKTMTGKEQFLKDLTKRNMKAYLNSNEFKRLTLQKRYSAIQDKLDNKYSMYIIREYLPAEYKIWIEENVKEQFLKDLT